MLRIWPLFLCCLLALVACQERVTPSAEEQYLLERLTRDPNVRVMSIERDDDKFLRVTTRQGNGVETYVFKPDVPGEKRLNIHHLAGSSRLEVSTEPAPGPWRKR